MRSAKNKDENKRVVDIPMIMPNGEIEHFYMTVANEVPDSIVWEMINKAVEEVRKGMASWH